MKIAIYTGKDQLATRGGAHTFETNITDGLLNHSGSNDYEFCTLGKTVSAGYDHPHRRETRAKFATQISSLFGQRDSRTLPAYAAGLDLIYSPQPMLPDVNLPSIVTSWDVEYRKQPFFPELMNGHLPLKKREQRCEQIFYRAFKVVVGTHEGSRELQHFYGLPESRIAVIPFPVPTTLIRETSRRPSVLPDCSFFFYPAQFWPHKNHVTLLDAVDKIQDVLRRQEIKIVLSGADKPQESGTLAMLKQLTRSMGIEDMIIFPGFLDLDEIKWLYENAIALVYCSLFGPDNLPPLEAMRLGCPVVAACIAGAHDQLGDACLWFDPLDSNHLAERLKTLTTRDSRIPLIEAGKKLARTRTLDTYTKGLMDLFAEFRGYRRLWADSRDSRHFLGG